MIDPLESIMEVREDLMVSPAGDSKPTLRTAHFLKPIASSIDEPVSEILSFSVPPIFEPKGWPLTIHFNGWRYPQKKWVEWVDALHLRYESVWKKAGIHEAIMCSKCYIVKNRDLALGVAEKWCSKTNTFVFPWGEATITLEDMMVLGGYPVLGDPVFSSLENQEMREVQKKLLLARQEPWRRKKGKASTSEWINLFINSGSKIEHEAFLACWLSMFVFSHNSLVKQSLFPIAIHLARGNTIALAPAVLASIYKDLGLFKDTIVGLAKNPAVGDKCLEITLQSPFYLVQIWVWERFKNLQPEPKLINHGDPMLFRWHKVKPLKIDNVRLALDSAVEDFLWRPYVKYGGKCRVFYPENEICVPFESDLDKELVSFATCLRVSLLVGIDPIKWYLYLPHRVAMQFGMDQDVPGFVPEFNGTKAIAWKNYCRPISDRNLYFPSRLFEADVTTRYARWWKQSVLRYHQDFVNNIVQRKKRSARSSKCGSHVAKANRSSDDADVPPGFPPKLVSTVVLGKSCDDSSNTRKGDNYPDVPPGFLPKRLKTVHSVQEGLKANENIDADVANRFLSKHDTLTPFISVENIKPVLEEDKCGGMTFGRGTIDQCKHLSNQCSSASPADSEDVTRLLVPLMKPVAKENVKPSIRGLEENFEDANESKESRASRDRVRITGTRGKGYSCASGTRIKELEHRISRLEGVITELKIARFSRS